MRFGMYDSNPGYLKGSNQAIRRIQEMIEKWRWVNSKSQQF